jgi:hypothetical protein
LLVVGINKKCVTYLQEDFLFKILYSILFFYPTEFEDSTQNHHKIITTPNQSIKMKIFPKKVCLVVYYLKSVKEPKIYMEDTRRNLFQKPQKYRD